MTVSKGSQGQGRRAFGTSGQQRGYLLDTTAAATLAVALVAGTADGRAGTIYSTDTVTNGGDRWTEPAGGASFENAIVIVEAGVAVTGAGAGVRGNLNLNILATHAFFENNGLVDSTLTPGENGVDVEGYAPLGIPVGNATYIGGAGSSVVGALNGVAVTGANAFVTLNGGDVTGVVDNGLVVTAVGDPLLGGRAEITLAPAAGTVTGALDAVNVLAIGVGRDAQTVITLQGGTLVGDSDNDGLGDGLVAASLAAGVTVPRTATNTITTAADISGANGITAVAMSGNGIASNTIVAGGTITGTDGEGIIAVAASADVDDLDDLDDLDLTGLVDLVDLSDFVNFDPSVFDGLPVGAGTANVDLTVTGTVTGAGNGVTAIAMGQSGVVDIDTTAGGAIGLDGFGVVGLAIGPSSTVTIAAGDVSGTLGGVLGISAAGDVDVTTSGLVTVDPDGFVGVGAIAVGGDATVTFSGIIDPPLIGIGVLTIGNGIAAVNASGIIDADSIGILAANTGNGQVSVNSSADIFSSVGAVPLIGISGDKFGDANTAGGPDVFISNSGNVTGFETGISGVANGVGNEVVVVNDGVVSDAAFGVSGAAIGNGAGGSVTVTNSGTVTDVVISGVVAAGIGDNHTVSLINTGAVTADVNGVVVSLVGTGNTASVSAGGTVTANEFAVSGNVFGDFNRISLDVTGTATGTDGLGVFGNITGNDGVLDISVEGTVTGGAAGIVAQHEGNRTSTNIVTTGSVVSTTGVGIIGTTFGTFTALNIVAGDVSAPLVGIAGTSIDNGFVTIDVNGAVRADLAGVVATKLGDGDVSVNVDGSIAGLTAAATEFAGVSVVSTFGNGLASVTTSASSSILSDIDAINILKQDSSAFDGTAINVVSLGSLTAGEYGLYIEHIDGDGDVLVETGSVINAGVAGMFVHKDNSVGDTTVMAGGVIEGTDGVLAYGDGQTGDLIVTTGAGGQLSALDVGILAGREFGGSGDLRVGTGAGSVITAGDAGILAYSTLGSGNDVSVVTGQFSTVNAGVEAIYVESAGNASVVVGDGATVRGDVAGAGIGNAIHIAEAGLAQVDVGAGAYVFASAQGIDDAVIRVTSDNGTAIEIGSGALVSAWSYNASTQLDLADAASRFVIDVEGAAGQVTNYGMLVGLVDMTDFADSFANLSSNSWATVGDNDFGAGADVVSNPGVIVTAVQGDVAERTSFVSLERFVNGNTAGSGGGLLSMIDETPGTLGPRAARDITYVSGTFASVGNGAVGLDTYIGGAGSTSDRLIIGGLDATGAPVTGAAITGTLNLLIHDVNAGPGAYNTAGIQLLDVENGSTAGARFALDPRSSNYSSRFGGVIDKGLFIYDLVTEIGSTGVLEARLVSAPDEEVFEFPSFVSAAQSVWHETSGVWLDRQADLRSYVLDPTLADRTGGPTDVTPGVWGKLIGSWSSRDDAVTYRGPGGLYEFDTSYNQDTYGFLAGADFGTTTGEATWVFGVLGGYVTSNVDMDNSSNGGTFTGGTVGAYATYLNGGFFVDALVKADILGFTYDTSSLSGEIAEDSDVTSLGFTLDTGYRFALGATTFIEPVATLSYVQTDFDALALPPSGTVGFRDGESLRASLGARFGGQIRQTENWVFEASVTGRYWYEFDGDNSVQFTAPGLTMLASDSLTGGFGEVGASLNWFAKEAGWNGFINANVKFSGDYTAGAAQAGLRYQW